MHHCFHIFWAYAAVLLSASESKEYVSAPTSAATWKIADWSDWDANFNFKGPSRLCRALILMYLGGLMHRVSDLSDC